MSSNDGLQNATDLQARFDLDHPMVGELVDHPLVEIARRPENRLRYEDLRADNNLRAGWAAVAILSTREGEGDDELESAMADLVGNLMHLADATGIDFETVYNKAEYYYGDEVAGVL